jgi:hypothetical protein
MKALLLFLLLLCVAYLECLTAIPACLLERRGGVSICWGIGCACCRLVFVIGVVCVYGVGCISVVQKRMGGLNDICIDGGV